MMAPFELGLHDLLLITLDTLRYDVAARCLELGQTPTLAARIGPNGWQRRHTPGSFTYAAHQAFFAGFLPTPARPGPHPRRFALAFEGSETTDHETVVLDGPDIVSGLRACGYHTICVGGVGFFNRQNALGEVLPGLFDEAHWSPALGVTDPRSTENQVRLALHRLGTLPAERRVFLFLNVSALHQPNCLYVPGASHDCPETMAAALAYVDGQLEPLFEAFAERGRKRDTGQERGAGALCIVCSDHGTAYGEDGFHGHRLAHPVIWEVPYAELAL
jgi:hypothetical protein